MAVNALQWLHQGEPFNRVRHVLSEEAAIAAYSKAEASMARLNRTGATLMRRHGSRGATDVTGFGILGHADNLAKNMRAHVEIVIHTLPIFAGMTAVNDVVDFKLTAGFSAETSGGLFAIFSPSAAEAFVRDIRALDGCDAWIVADVVAASQRGARISPDVRVVEV